MPFSPINSHVPDTIPTDRLVLRAFQTGDGAELNALIHDSFDALNRWMPWARNRPTVAETETHVRESIVRWRVREELNFAIVRREDNVLIGSCGFHTVDWSVPRVEIGYWLGTKYEGSGYMTEAVRGMTRFAFIVFEAERIEIRCDARNRASAAVAERAGYRLEATMRRQARDHHGVLRDTLVYAMLKDDPNALTVA